MKAIAKKIGKYLLNIGSKRYRYERRLAREVIRQIPKEDLQRLSHEYSQTKPDGTRVINAKYLDILPWMQIAASRAVELGLHKSKGLSILDIGCGNGYFLAVARYLGHSIQGIDVPVNPMYNEFIKLLNIPRIEHRVSSFTPLPNLDKKFDIITGYMVQFNWSKASESDSGKEEYWNFDSWRYLIDDCKSNLVPSGRIRFELNKGHQAEFMWLPDDVAAGIRKYANATIPQSKWLIDIESEL